ncbi:nSTAND3 domain-containing NTPase [Peterkaempfera griseoplana]|uniref:nSTAND3 domain-containing NTPase n=1 Tax=Peterkaempfera griseoplana TaxID=66896 RepID=UPI0006E451F0|nr:hypothetical protein [Peterkaempfera griseoplana]
MSDPITTHLHDARGPVHAGSGPQINFVLRDRQGRNPRAVADEQIRWLHQRFVPPQGFSNALETLKREGIVLLDGEPGSGRSAAALMLLRGMQRHTEATFQEVDTRSDEPTGAPRLDPEAVGDRARLLLDLSAVDEHLWHAVHDELPSFCKTVKDRGAHLVVVLPHDPVQQIRTDLNPYKADISAPHRPYVLQRYLRQAGIPVEETAGTPMPVVSDLLAAGRPMREVARLADFIVRARDAAGGEGSFAEWCDQARAAVTDRRREVADLVTELRNGPQRALLITAAMMHGALADAVHRGAALLLHTTRYPQDETPALEHTDLAERLAEVRAVADPHGKVHFDSLGYDAAVRMHFWDHMPQLRRPLSTWVAAAVELSDLLPEDRDALALRFADQCLRSHRYLAMLVALVTRWTENLAPGRLRPAALILERGLQHQEHGRYFRQQTYDWSRTSNLPGGLVQILVEICGSVLAVRYPDEAMVRLHHLARRQPQSRAGERLIDLVLGDRRLYRRMLDRLAQSPAGYRWPAVDAELFRTLARPAHLTDHGPGDHSLLTEPGMPSRLADGWRHVFDHHLRQGTERHLPVQDWLCAARDDEGHRALLLDTLITACGQNPVLHSHLYVTARDWAHHPGELRASRAVVTDCVLQKIGAAQAAPKPV